MTEQHDYAPYNPPALGPRRSHRRRHIILFVATFVTTTLVGASHYAAFISEFNRFEPALSWSLLFGGLWYSCGVLGILGAHEMGHYVACRYYKLNASLPYFLPFILPVNAFQTGTLGAVIRIRSPFPTRTVLFDVGVAGPIAGFVVLVPVLFFGLSQSQMLPLPTTGAGVYLGEPLLFQWATALVHGPMREGFGLNAHPMVFASWFGMLATALNLLPFGQLDGGHITYATLGRFSTPISILTVGGAVVMTFISSSWLVLTVMMVVMLVVLGPRHPRVLYEYEPLSPGRRLLAVAALLILALCSTPVPIEPYQLISER
jgi:membrane-associated protease RseP (regulator of RpoE activity)